MNQELVIISIDIETRGQGPYTHGIVSVGVCVGSSTEENIIEKCRFDMLPMDGQIMEPRCFNEFWSIHQDHFVTLTKNAKDPLEQTARFRELIDRYPNSYIVCDNPGFDFGMINYYLDMAHQPNLNYIKNADGSLTYRNNHDCDSYGRCLMRCSFNEQWLSNDQLIKAIGCNLDSKCRYKKLNYTLY